MSLEELFPEPTRKNDWSSLQQLVATLPPTPKTHWLPLLYQLESLESGARDLLMENLAELARGSAAWHAQLEAQSNLLNQSSQERELDRIKLLELRAALDEAEIGILTGRFDRDCLNVTIDNLRKMSRSLLSKLVEARREIEDLRRWKTE